MREDWSCDPMLGGDIAMSGEKHDKGKDRWDLLPLREVREVVRVLTFGAAKYGVGNWVHVAEARPRYLSAFLRHVAAWQLGEERDPETGLHHLAHAICSLLFLMFFDLEGERCEKTGPATPCSGATSMGDFKIEPAVRRGIKLDQVVIEALKDLSMGSVKFYGTGILSTPEERACSFLVKSGFAEVCKVGNDHTYTITSLGRDKLKETV